MTARTPPRGMNVVDGASAGPRSLGERRRQVLVVEDEVDFRDTLEVVLALEGLVVTAVGDGAAAIAAARRCRFDLVITDLRMPGMSGIDTIAALKQIDPEVPVIVATGYASDEIAEECAARGAGHVLRKPFELKELVDLVLRALR